MGETILVPGGRDVRATLDESGGDATACVVACPPHPELGGTRTDGRLRAVADELTARGADCLRFDYGPWDEGYGERADALRAVAWAAGRYDRVAIFGFSFGGAMALLAAAETSDVVAVSALAPAAAVADDLNVVDAFERIAVPVQVVYGTRDGVADWEPVVECARRYEQSVVEFAADHHFVGQTERVAEVVVDFLGPFLQGDASR
jgi:hypothetical protein